MNTRLTTIQVDPNSALIIEGLKERAKAEGVTLDVLLKKIAEGLEKESSQPGGMLAVIGRSAQRLKRMPFSGTTKDSLKILDEGRGGEMYGYGS